MLLSLSWVYIVFLVLISGVHPNELRVTLERLRMPSLRIDNDSVTMSKNTLRCCYESSTTFSGDRGQIFEEFKTFATNSR